MATCPDCGEYLSAHHRCRGRVRRMFGALGYVAAGALIGYLASFAIEERPAEALRWVTALLGALLVFAFRRYARF